MNETTKLSVLVAEARTALDLVAHVAEGAVWVVNDRGDVLYGSAEGQKERGEAAVPLRVDAEEVGKVAVCGKHAREVAELVTAVLDAVHKRKMVVDVYRETLSDSYEELLERNCRLAKLAESLEEQVRVRTRELDEAHAQLARDEKVAAIGRLAAGLAHELNTPLACICSNLGRLGDGLPPEGEAAAMVRESLEMAERAAGIVRDVRGFSHVDDMGCVEVDLNGEIDRIVARLDVPGGVEVEKEYGVLSRVPVDGRLLTLGLLHVLENARDAVAKGGKIVISTAMEDGQAVVYVEDDGPGVPPEIMQRVFDPFFTTKEVGQGTGLGLTVARNIARAHGGELTLECGPRGGTAARLTIPSVSWERQS